MGRYKLIMSIKVDQIKVYKDGAWQDITKVHDGSAYQNFRGVYSGGYWYELSTCSLWDIECYELQENSTTIPAEGTSPQDIYVKPDGTMMFEYDDADDTIYQYSLSTAWDITTATYEKSHNFSNLYSHGHSIFFKTDGTKLYLNSGSDSTSNFSQFSLSTAWDIGTLTLEKEVSTDVGYHIDAKGDGTKFYGAVDGTLKQYTLSTAWDIATISFEKSVSLSAGRVFAFKPDGTKFYIRDFPDIKQYSLSTAWDIATYSYEKKADRWHNGFQFKDDGYAIYAIQNTDPPYIQQSNFKG